MQTVEKKHSNAIRWLTSIGAVLGCSVLIAPLLGLRGVWFHFIYGGLYLVFSTAYYFLAEISMVRSISDHLSISS